VSGWWWRWRPLLARPESALYVLARSGFRWLQRLIAVSKWPVLEVDGRLQRLLLQLVEGAKHCGDTAACIIAACVGQAVQFLLCQKIQVYLRFGGYVSECGRRAQHPGALCLTARRDRRRRRMAHQQL